MIKKYTMIRISTESYKRLKALAKKEKRTIIGCLSVLLDKVKQR